MNRPVAVCISDIHFNLNTIEIASLALSAAINKAKELNIPLVIAGDLNDTKAIIRAEVANRLIELLSVAKTDGVRIYILEGNHDKINEKGVGHGLNYLKPYCTIIDTVTSDLLNKITLIPYFSDKDELQKVINSLDPLQTPILIMHQGFLGAYMGDYVQDKSSLDPDAARSFIVISGHYHKHQTIGSVTYIGSPYTITFGEANDGPKGFIILNTDGTFTREILSLPSHRIIELDQDQLKSLTPLHHVKSTDKVWIKIRGSRSELDKINKKTLGEKILGHFNFKLDLIPSESEELRPIDDTLSYDHILDSIIDAVSDAEPYKNYLKKLWRELL